MIISPFIMRILCVVIFITIMTPYVLLLRWSQENFGFMGVAVTAALCIGLALLLVSRMEHRNLHGRG
jgi:hypothetical protein